MKFDLKTIMKPMSFSLLKVGIVSTIAILFYDFVWAQPTAVLFGQNSIPSIIAFGGSTIAIAVLGKNFKVL